jgi:hypothetical protein
MLPFVHRILVESMAMDFHGYCPPSVLFFRSCCGTAVGVYMFTHLLRALVGLTVHSQHVWCQMLQGAAAPLFVLDGRAA